MYDNFEKATDLNVIPIFEHAESVVLCSVYDGLSLVFWLLESDLQLLQLVLCCAGPSSGAQLERNASTQLCSQSLLLGQGGQSQARALSLEITLGYSWL